MHITRIKKYVNDNTTSENSIGLFNSYITTLFLHTMHIETNGEYMLFHCYCLLRYFMLYIRYTFAYIKININKIWTCFDSHNTFFTKYF